MSTAHNIAIIIITLAFFDYITSDCINGTSTGCSEKTTCFLNICYPSGGPCSNGQCGEGLICVNGTCLNISAPTTSATTATTTTTTTETTTTTTTTTVTTTTPKCVDRSASGRASDCPAVKHLCDNAIYFQLMTEQCPFTCGRCPGISPRPNPACSDRVGADGTSNCASVSFLCQNSLYRQLMREQCPKTCGYCK